MESNLNGLQFYNGLLAPLESLLIKMERRGLLIDIPYFNSQAEKAEEREDVLIRELNEWTLQEGAGIINWRSSDQQLHFFHDILHLIEKVTLDSHFELRLVCYDIRKSRWCDKTLTDIVKVFLFPNWYLL